MPGKEGTDHFGSDSVPMPVQWGSPNTSYQNPHPQAQADLVANTSQAIQVFNLQLTRWEHAGVNPHMFNGGQ